MKALMHTFERLKSMLGGDNIGALDLKKFLTKMWMADNDVLVGKVLTSRAIYGMLETMVDVQWNPSPLKTIKVSPSGMGLTRLVRWLRQRCVAYTTKDIHANGVMVKYHYNTEEAVVALVARLCELTQERVTKAEQIYIEGETHCGKSTLEKLLYGLFPKLVFSISRESSKQFTPSELIYRCGILKHVMYIQVHLWGGFQVPYGYALNLIMRWLGGLMPHS